MRSFRSASRAARVAQSACRMRLLVSLWKMFSYTAGAAVLGLAVYEFWFLAQILYWVEHNPATTRVMDAEDAKFVDHEGFDWEGIQRAMDKNQRRGKFVAGGSTITQQVAKNLFLSGERSLLRKGQEAILAAMLEASMDKRRIFEIYLNVAEWGENVFGAEAAARHYFGVGAAGLEPEQAARLAAMLPRPRYYDHNRDSAYLANYSESILAQMSAAQVP